ncbi:MAG: serine phosphatase [Chloroflexus sp.]|uniref:GAF domain-containing SpoIIE family protein phosphatase n=1 Tax=Chloroflexus sp. TaxID=1904827 RepID=UPI0021DE082A|nr:GAF domain-containing SpoIIE family protein phosphatase [Chloroflexus sp.]GIV88283.1 MAG: serine phosphatase [Chloroflexus sp.]
MSREHLLTWYGLIVGGVVWGWLLLLPTVPTVPALVVLFAVLAFAVDLLAFRTPPADVHSLAPLVLVSASLALGPIPAAWIAAVEGFVSGVTILLQTNRPRTLFSLLGRPLLRSGLRALGLLAGAWLATMSSGQPLTALPMSHVFGWTLLSFPFVTQLGRIVRELLQGGYSGLATWWRSAWPAILGAEIAPLPLAWLGAAIAHDLGMLHLILAGGALVASAAILRRSSLNLQRQRRSMRELARLNEVSRAIIRSELDVDALCELIYREASRIVDTSSFHLGLFNGHSYTLVVRVQDRVRLPRLTVDLSENSGLIGWIRETGRAILVEDFTREMDRLPARPRYQSERPPRSGIYVPLIAGETVIGSISVQSYEPSAFDANDLRLISLIADQAAVAIARARAFHEARQRANQLQAIREVSQQITAILNLDRLLPSIVQLIRERFGYHPVHIFTLSPDDERIYFRASTADGADLERLRALSLRIGQGLVGEAVQRGEPVLVGDVLNDHRAIRDTLQTRSELAVPLRVGTTVIGVLDVQSDEPDDFDEDDLFVIRTLADQIAIAIESANAYTAQQEEAWTLNALLQIAENIGRATTLSDLLATVVRLPPLLMGCPRCYVALWDREQGDFVVRAVYGLPTTARTGVLNQPTRSPFLWRLRERAAETDQPRLELLWQAQDNADQWPTLITAARSGTLVGLPISARNTLLGVLVLDYNDPFVSLSTRQQNLCTGAAAQIAGTLESLLLAAEAAEAARLEQELRVAREIQQSLLPTRLPNVTGWQIEATWQSARLVGGDFYDFWSLPTGTEPPRELGFVIADVSDKGIPAAMFMTMARSLVRAAALDGSAPARAMERANRWLYRDSESGMFVTLFYARLDLTTGQLCYTCAGHNPPLLYRAATGEIEELRTPGIALGVLPEVTLAEAEAQLAPEDVLVCYTDGATETINELLVPFDVDGLRAVIKAYATGPAATIMQAILAAVARHSHGQPPFDDITLIVIKRAST